jgi:hypothetical protein
MAEGAAYASILITLSAGIFLGIRRRREKEHAGLIPFSKAFSTGWTIALFASIVVYMAVYSFFEFNGDQWRQRYYQHQQEVIQSRYTVPAQRTEKLRELDKRMVDSATDYQNVNSQAAMAFFIVLFFGTIISAASAVIQRKE